MRRRGWGEGGDSFLTTVDAIWGLRTILRCLFSGMAQNLLYVTGAQDVIFNQLHS